MKLRYLLITLLSLGCFSPISAEELVVNYSYNGSHNTDFSNISVSLKIEDVLDDRDGEPRQIADEYLAEIPLSEMIYTAIVQGLEHGGAELVESDQDMQIQGRIVSSELRTVDRAGVESLQLTIRTHVALQGRGRTIWETTLFGRGTVPAQEGVAAALVGSLDRMVRELVNDDYFIIELQ
tara:strand:- start:100 stop:639 length:540 start_codon:yes stop_codon:yes gene_type:complete